jgi:cell wall-associated NlpC family hydrolase
VITTLITATILARVLAGGPQAPMAHPCPEAGDGWELLLSEAALPDKSWRRFLEGIRTALAAACEAKRAESGSAPQPDKAGSGVAPQADQAEPGFTPQADQAGSGVTSQADQTESEFAPQADQADSGFVTGDIHIDAGPSGTDDGWTASADGSSRSEPPTRVRPPTVLSSMEPRASRPSRPRAAKTSPSLTSPSLAPAEPSQRPSQLAPAKPSQRPSQLAPAKQSQRPSHGQIAAVAALRQVGRPYVWGGGSSAGPTGGGFDCSGLALHAWSKAGATLSHYTGSQFRQGRSVPFSQLRPGDLVFFGGGTGDPTHVGVYVKDGVMVHAPKRGDVVKTTNFADSVYYRLHYRGAVRPAPM